MADKEWQAEINRGTNWLGREGWRVRYVRGSMVQIGEKSWYRKREHAVSAAREFLRQRLREEADATATSVVIRASDLPPDTTKRSY